MGGRERRLSDKVKVIRAVVPMILGDALGCAVGRMGDAHVVGRGNGLEHPGRRQPRKVAHASDCHHQPKGRLR